MVCEHHENLCKEQGDVASELTNINGKLDLLLGAIHQGDVTFENLKTRVGHLEKFSYGVGAIALAALASGVTAIFLAKG